MSKKTFNAAWPKCENDQLKRSIRKEEISSISSDSNERLIKIEMMLKMMNNSFMHLSNQLSEIKHTIKYHYEK